MSDRTKANRDLVTIKMSSLLSVVLTLPSFGIIFCVLWSLAYDFESSTATHCRVRNYLPTISSATGGYTPQLYVWRVCIALHCFPRLIFAISYCNFHTIVHVGNYNPQYKTLAKLCSVLHSIEIFSLVGLTYISSKDSSDVHENLFVSFMVFSLVYMLLTCILFYWGRTHNGRVMTQMEIKSLKLKMGFFLSNISAFLLSVYLYFRHNTYCEPGVYSWFAFWEYVAVFTNIAFHGTLLFDFGNYKITVGTGMMSRST